MDSGLLQFPEDSAVVLGPVDRRDTEDGGPDSALVVVVVRLAAEPEVEALESGSLEIKFYLKR